MNEVFISYLAKESITMIMQSSLLYVVLLLLCDIPCRGSVTLAICITFLQGFSGMCFGNEWGILCNLIIFYLFKFFFEIFQV